MSGADGAPPRVSFAPTAGEEKIDDASAKKGADLGIAIAPSDGGSKKEEAAAPKDDPDAPGPRPSMSRPSLAASSRRDRESMRWQQRSCRLSCRALAKPSYHTDRFHEHFFPHGSLPDPNGASGKKPLSLPARYAVSMARRPKTHFSVAFVIAVVLSFLGLRFGDLKIQIDNVGWWSRGTLIADRASQDMMMEFHQNDLFYDESGEFWEELLTEVQPSWERMQIEDEVNTATGTEEVDDETIENVCSGRWYGSMDMVRHDEKNLQAVWRTDDAEAKEPELNMLDGKVIYDLCVAEENTLGSLEGSDTCYKCPLEGADDRCIDPYSLVLMARSHLSGNDPSKVTALSKSISCDALKDSWTPTVQRQFTTALKTCLGWTVMMAGGTDNGMPIQVTNPCPFPFMVLPTVVDEAFPNTDDPIVRYSSSFFATKKGDALEKMYESSEAGDFDRLGGGSDAEGAYDTPARTFYDYYSEAIAGRDMTLAVGSALVTVVAMLVHTRSPFLTLMGLFQILLSFPLAYFVYYFVARLVFFPFLNFIGIFVVFALGADDVFVAVDNWKNARHELPHATTEQVAALALPDAAYAMLLTSTTTAVAFFGTAICPVGPIVCFAIFCGLLITFDYMMNIFLVFPALCLYDQWLLAGSKNCCVNFDWCCGKKEDADTGNAEDVERNASMEVPDWQTASMRVMDWQNASMKLLNSVAERDVLIEAEHQVFIHRILDGYYKLLHKFKWAVLFVTTAGFITCVVFAAQLSLPTSSDVALLPDSNQYIMRWNWNEKLLSTQLAKEGGTEARIWYGLEPADTGDHLNPDSWTTLVLDETFAPSSEESQSYLLGFCQRLFDEFGKVETTYSCPMNLFDAWLQEQSTSDKPTEAYTQNCAGASQAPVPADVFDPCMIAYSKLTDNTAVLSLDGSVKMIEVRSKSDVLYDAPFNELNDEWTSIETWLDDERSSAPDGVNKAYHTNQGFWWYDTNQEMLKTAYGAAGIALACASVIIFISSRSFILTLFATLSIAYVLVAATACLVGLGWELGFLEAILFAILIGISCDFVIHFSHAYAMYSGDVDRGHRSHFAVTHMGPSILAAAFTTFMAAVVMIFTEILFFRKFSVMLFMTIVHSIIGCFVVFIILCDCFGPAEPTKGYDTIKSKLCRKPNE